MDSYLAIETTIADVAFAAGFGGVRQLNLDRAHANDRTNSRMVSVAMGTTR